MLIPLGDCFVALRTRPRSSSQWRGWRPWLHYVMPFGDCFVALRTRLRGSSQWRRR